MVRPARTPGVEVPLHRDISGFVGDAPGWADRINADAAQCSPLTGGPAAEFGQVTANRVDGVWEIRTGAGAELYLPTRLDGQSTVQFAATEFGE